MKKNISLLAVCFFITACSMTTKRDSSKNSKPTTSPPPAQAAEATPPAAAAPATTTPGAPSTPETHAAANAPTAGTAPVDNAVAAAVKHITPHEEITGTAPEKALSWLKNGNTRFLKGYLRKDGQSKSDIERLSSGQQPHSIILSCSDSRVPPEVLFDQKLGEIFVVRTAGEALDGNAIGSIEYAVEHLGSRLIVVMGHTSCGAVKAAFNTLGGSDAGSPALNHLVADIHPRIKQYMGKSPSAKMQSESLANAKGVASDLLGRSKIIEAAVKSGKVQIKVALYDLNTGAANFEE